MNQPLSGTIFGIPKFTRRRWVRALTKMLAAGGFSAMASAADEERWWLSRPADPYPLVDCVVCDSILDEDAEFFDIDGREIRVCGNVDCGTQFSNSIDRWLAEADERMVELQKPLYPLEICLVSGESLETSGAVEFVFRNRLFLLCCEDCRDALKKDPEKYFGLLNKAVIEKQKTNYPLDKCIVSGQPLGENALDHVVANQLVRLADEEQIEAFDKTAGQYLAELRKLAKESAGSGSQ
jgi:hypothetical protein